MNYWENAALIREAENYKEAGAAIREMLELYDAALKDIQGEIDKIVYNYGKRFGIDEETAKLYLSRAMQEGGNDELIGELLNGASDEERKALLDFIHLDGLSTRAYGARAQTYKALSDNIALRMISLERSLRTVGEAARRDAYRSNYYRAIDDTAKGLNVGVGFGIIDDAALENVMEKPWHGKRFSARIWDNTDRLADEAQEIVGKYIISGRDPKKAAQELAEAFEVEKFHAETLIRTEIAHARSMSDMKAYEDIGTKRYRYLATLDERTCPVCGGLDGKSFELSEAAEGVNYPVMHPRCRCTTTMDIRYFRRRARNPITGRNEVTDGGLTYDTWRQNMSDEEKAAFEKAGRKYRNKAADKRQYEEYKAIFGKDFPNGLDKFQEMKYDKNRKEEWELFKSQKQERLNKMDFKDMSGLVGKLGNREVRIWYKQHDENIPDLIDRTKPIEEQARQACDLRNSNRTAARELMRDQELRKQLDITDPNHSFEELIDSKMLRKNLTREEAIKDILKTATKTNENVNKQFGLE